MRHWKLACAAVLTVAATACGGGDSDNVMAQQANALSPEQVDAALGPEASNTVENEPGTTDAADAARPLNVTETPPAPSTADEEPADDTPDATITDTNSSEQ